MGIKNTNYCCYVSITQAEPVEIESDNDSTFEKTRTFQQVQTLMHFFIQIFIYHWVLTL